MGRDRYDLVVGFDLDGWLVRSPAARYVVALKGILADEARFERGPTRLRLRALARLERRNARRAARVLVTSRYCHDVAVAAYGLSPDRLGVVPEGIDLELWQPGGAPRAEATPTILSVARQYPRKNTATLLLALDRVRHRVPDAVLRIVGGGPELPALRALTARLGLGSRVRFLGALPTAEEVQREYARADLFCLPSLQEGFGIVFLEAMAMGVPIVAARAGAVPEVVPAAAGELVDGRDPAALAEALIGLLTDPPRRRRMGEAGRRQARNFAWPRIAGEFLTEALRS